MKMLHVSSCILVFCSEVTDSHSGESSKHVTSEVETAKIQNASQYYAGKCLVILISNLLLYFSLSNNFSN